MTTVNSSWAASYMNDFGNAAGYRQAEKSAKSFAPAPKPVSGSGLIEGNHFKSVDGERYELKVKNFGTYNLLTDKGISMNGRYREEGGSLELSSVAFSLKDTFVTFSRDGQLMIGDQVFDRKKNNLNGAVTVDGKEFVLTTDEYTFRMRANGNEGVKVKVEARNVTGDGVLPDGLWGASNDGSKNSQAELARMIRPRDYDTGSMMDFSALGKDAIEDADGNNRFWQAFNPKVEREVVVGVDGANFYGDSYRRQNGANFLLGQFAALKAGSTYNLFSDLDLQVSGKVGNTDFNDGSVKVIEELYIVTAGDEYKISIAGDKLSIKDSDGDDVSLGGDVTLNNGVLSIKSEDGDESRTIEVKVNGDDNGLRNAWQGGLDFRIKVNGFGNNDVRSSGLLGDGIGVQFGGIGEHDNGLTYIRDANGNTMSKDATAKEIKKALAEYLIDPFDTEGGRSVYGGYKIDY